VSDSIPHAARVHVPPDGDTDKHAVAVVDNAATPHRLHRMAREASIDTPADDTTATTDEPFSLRAPVRLVGGPPPGAARLASRGACAWFGDHLVLEDVDLDMPANEVTALIGPSGCGKSTFLRLLNRMHELVPGAALAGEILLDGDDIYRPGIRAQQVRLRIGMVFQKPNPFPAMSVRDNVLAGLKLARVRCSNKDDLVEQSLRRAGLWREVRDRLRSPGGALSGGQQQRLCIARALAVQPNVLLMDEPCSALDPTSTRRIEETITEMRNDVTVVIVTHNMQQAYRVSDSCAFFLAAENDPGRIVEHGPTEKMFSDPDDPRTLAYVEGRFG
jgi:phosphate transport system ATP-binding protein